MMNEVEEEQLSRALDALGDKVGELTAERDSLLAERNYLEGRVDELTDEVNELTERVAFVTEGRDDWAGKWDKQDDQISAAIDILGGRRR